MAFSFLSSDNGLAARSADAAIYAEQVVRVVRLRDLGEAVAVGAVPRPDALLVVIVMIIRTDIVAFALADEPDPRWTQRTSRRAAPVWSVTAL